MALPNLTNIWLEWNKFKESTAVAGQVGVVVINPDGTTIAGGGSGGQQYVDAASTPAHPTGGVLVFDNSGVWKSVSAVAGLPVNVVAGAAGGGAAQLQIRNAADSAWQNVGDGTESATSRYVPVKAIDGALASIGATSDAASASTVIGRLKAILALFPTAAALADATANPTLTQAAAYNMGYNGTTWDRLKATSGSLNVHLDSQTVVVNGSGVTQPVSGTFWQATQPVSGTVTATGPLTDTQLRASAVPVTAVLTTGAAVIGHVIADTGSTTAVTGTVAVTESGTWTVQPGNTPNTTAWLTSQQAATAGGCVPYSYIAAASANQDAQQIGATAARQLYAWSISNVAAAPRWVKFYNVAAPTSASTPSLRIFVPANATAANGAGSNFSSDTAAAFSTALSFRITTGVADNDTGAATANDVVVNAFYK